MITIFNRREVYNGFSMEDLSDVRDCLELNKIKYTYRCVSLSQSGQLDTGRAAMGSFGEDMRYTVEYYVYVHKNNYELACYILSQRKSY